MNTSSNGIDLIKRFESCRLSAYPDLASPLGKLCQQRGVALDHYAQIDGWQALGGSPWSIGWGDAGPDVVPGLTITQWDADCRLLRKVASFEAMLNADISYALTQDEFDALVSILYNVGPGRTGRAGILNLGNGEPSSLIRAVNAGDFETAAEDFLSWDRAGGIVVAGLLRRRRAEQALFTGGDWRAFA